MSPRPDFLPECIPYQGDWQRFLERTYLVFTRDFKNSRPALCGKVVVFDTALDRGLEEGFWHVTTERDTKGHRLPKFDRMERIAWIRAIIENADRPEVSHWTNKRGAEVRHILWVEAENFVVILGERKKVMALVTAYCTDRAKTQAQLRADRAKAKKANAANTC